MQIQSKDLPQRIIEEDGKLDQFTDSGSDEQNNFELEVPEVDKLMKQFEQGDESMKTIRERAPDFATQYSEELVKLNSNIR